MSDQLDDGTAEAGVGGEDNDLIRSLRADIKTAKEAEKAALTAATTAQADARTSLEREMAAQKYVDAAGFSGLRDVVLDKVDGEVTEESVQAVFKDLGLTPMEVAQSDGEAAPSGDVAQKLADTASLGQRVSAAAQGQEETDIVDALNKAQTIEEVTAIAAQGGFYDPEV